MSVKCKYCLETANPGDWHQCEIFNLQMRIAEMQAKNERLLNKIAELQAELREAINNAAMEGE